MDERLSARLRPLLAAYAGLEPPGWALETRVRARAAALALDDEAYVARLERDGEELLRLVELLRVGETRFFRHQAQLDVLAERVLPGLPQPVAAWSAGCASGEEAWTLAMLLAERGLPFALTATDLSPAALARARRGVYPAARVEAEVPRPLVQRYFRRISDGELGINDRLRPHVRFLEHNLLAPQQPRELDLVLCRNVLIYFDGAARAEAVAKLVRALKPGGWLLVGYSESLRDVGELSGEAHAVYRKRVAAAPPAMGRPQSRPTTAPHAKPKSAPALIPNTPTPRSFALRGDYLDGKRLAQELRPLLGHGPALIDLDGASFLGDDAARVLRRAVEAAPHLTLRATRPAVRRWLAKHGIRSR
jgi:chemotaxis protein methyltransferase CheR